ncbi:hypothetical protein B7P34_08765 [Streptosporangium nondiastaticum]|uniref:Uncharacterized protein n=1 Tax=Streptosporangium nondiastaticum TaxID=35764 RepID=A0A9X7JSV6_9ACTN|nr:hypothetical protein [Streptosporangium nondiastaticum]PSJ29187.1 hypothetical protein B7P34_08765 [Streptosporangium nondiastaticum]
MVVLQGMKNRIVTRIAVGSALLVCGAVSASGTAQAAGGGGLSPRPLMNRLAHLTDVEDSPVGDTVSFVNDKLPKEASSRISLR